MKASIDYSGNIHLESENGEEFEQLDKFREEGWKHGFYGIASAVQYSNRDEGKVTVTIGVDKDPPEAGKRRRA